MRNISHALARVIASEWHGGQTSDLCSLATTGKITNVNVLRHEISRCISDTREITMECKAQLLGLDKYVRDRGVGDYDGDVKWSSLWTDETYVDIMQCSYCPFCDSPPGSPAHYDSCIGPLSQMLGISEMNDDDDPSLILGC